MKIFKNLIDYHDPSLRTVDIRGILYRTRLDFEPSAILAQSSGTGSRNIGLAQAVNDARTYFNKKLPAMLQQEILRAYSDRFSLENVVGIGDSPEKGLSLFFSKLSTEDVLKSGKEQMNKRGLDPKKVLYVAHPAHIYRVIKIAEKLEMDGEAFIQEEVLWGASNESQLRIQNPNIWALREILTRIHHNLTGVT